MSDDASGTGRTILIEIWFDVRCPWCYIGKQRVEAAALRFATEHPGMAVEIDHHSFELAPAIEERFDGTEAEYLQKYEGAPLEHSKRMLSELQRLGASEGLELRFDELRLVNTHRAHQLFQWGRSLGAGERLLDRLFTAYFSECRDMADPEVLADLAAEVGLDREQALAAVHPEAGGHWDETVYRDHIRAARLGAQGVPFALVNAKYRVSGAYSAESWAGALAEVVRRDFA